MSARLDQVPLMYDPLLSGVSACQCAVPSSCTMTRPSVSRIIVLVLNVGWFASGAHVPAICLPLDLSPPCQSWTGCPTTRAARSLTSACVYHTEVTAPRHKRVKVGTRKLQSYPRRTP